MRLPMTTLKCNEMFQSGDGWEPCQMDAGHWPNLPHGKPLASTGDTPQPQEFPAKLEIREFDSHYELGLVESYEIYNPANGLGVAIIPLFRERAENIAKKLAAAGKTPDALTNAETLSAWIEYWSTLDDSNVPDLWSECDTSIELGKFIAEKLAATLPAREAKEK